MKKIFIIGGGILLVIFLIYLIDKYFLKPSSVKYKFKAPSTMNYISELNPLFQPMVEKFISEIESPTNGNQRVLIVSGKRSLEKQAQLASGAGDTNTKISLHNFGFAIDINVTGTDKNGKPINLKLASPSKDWQPIVAIAKKLGFTWGGDFKNTPTPDRVHFSYTGGHSTEHDFVSILKNKEIDSDGFVIV